MEESLIFFPAPANEGDWHPPGLVFEEVWLQAADATKIHAWYVPHEQAARGRALLPRKRREYQPSGRHPAHAAPSGRRIGVDFRLPWLRAQRGKPNEPGILADARAARAWLAQREKIAEADVVLMGESLGGAVAVDLAAADGARALVLESTFTSIPDVAAHFYPWLPVRLLMHTRLDALAKIGAYHGPLLQSHGDPDTIIAIDFGRRLFAAANEPKQFITLPGVDHNDPRPLSYYDALAAFLDRLPPRNATDNARNVVRPRLLGRA